jgi:hypothetical protein
VIDLHPKREPLQGQRRLFAETWFIFFSISMISLFHETTKLALDEQSKYFRDLGSDFENENISTGNIKGTGH